MTTPTITDPRLTELAELGMTFKDDTLKFHFLLACGREDDPVFKTINDRRMQTAAKMDELAEGLGLK